MSPSGNCAAFGAVLAGVFPRGGNWEFHLHPEFLLKSLDPEKLERQQRKQKKVYILVPLIFSPQILEFCPLGPTDNQEGTFRESFVSHVALIASPLKGCHLLFGVDHLSHLELSLSVLP